MEERPTTRKYTPSNSGFIWVYLVIIVLTNGHIHSNKHLHKTKRRIQLFPICNKDILTTWGNFRRNKHNMSYLTVAILLTLCSEMWFRTVHLDSVIISNRFTIFKNIGIRCCGNTYWKSGTSYPFAVPLVGSWTLNSIPDLIIFRKSTYLHACLMKLE